MSDFGDLIFQAKCQIDYLEDAIEGGGKAVAYDPDTGTITLWLADESEQTIYTGPWTDLIDRLKRLPSSPPEGGA